jgi:hypothetical protein
MKKLITLTAICCLALFAVAIGVEKPWFDMQNCDFCKVFTAEKGLMEHTQMEFHPIANGVAQMTWVAPEYKEACTRAQANAMKLAEAIQKGEKHTVCQFCENLGSFMQGGCKKDEFTSRDATVTVFSSTDPTMVTKMHDWAKKTTEAMAKMATAE